MERDLQFVLLGSGEPRYEEFFRAAARAAIPSASPCASASTNGWRTRSKPAPILFLMPSLYEPCGLNQMFSLKYGTIPDRPRRRRPERFRAGLRSAKTTRAPAWFSTDYDAAAMLAAIDRGLSAYGDKKAWTALRRRAMAMDFSWERSAQLYSDLYRTLVP